MHWATAIPNFDPPKMVVELCINNVALVFVVNAVRGSSRVFILVERCCEMIFVLMLLVFLQSIFLRMRTCLQKKNINNIKKEICLENCK